MIGRTFDSHLWQMLLMRIANIICSIQQNNFVHRTYQHIGMM